MTILTHTHQITMTTMANRNHRALQPRTNTDSVNKLTRISNKKVPIVKAMCLTPLTGPNNGCKVLASNNKPIETDLNMVKEIRTSRIPDRSRHLDHRQ